MSVRQTVEIKNRLGMHARPAMKLFELVQEFDATVTLRNENGVEAEANSVIALLMLDSAQGGQIEIQASGADEQQALEAVVSLFNAGFDEECLAGDHSPICELALFKTLSELTMIVKVRPSPPMPGR